LDVLDCGESWIEMPEKFKGAMTIPSRRDFAKYVLAGGAGMLAPRGLWPAAAVIRIAFAARSDGHRVPAMAEAIGQAIRNLMMRGIFHR
jgi:hypothetical protein